MKVILRTNGIRKSIQKFSASENQDLMRENQCTSSIKWEKHGKVIYKTVDTIGQSSTHDDIMGKSSMHGITWRYNG